MNDSYSLDQIVPVPGLDFGLLTAGEYTRTSTRFGVMTLIIANEDPPTNECAPGTFSSSGIEPCLPCALGTFQPNAEQTLCLLCGAGSEAPTIGFDSCDLCMPGEFSADRTACLPCPAGTVSTGYGSDQCTSCAPGTEAPTPGLAACLTCSVGTYAPNSGTASRIQCACDDGDMCTVDTCDRLGNCDCRSTRLYVNRLTVNGATEFYIPTC